MQVNLHEAQTRVSGPLDQAPSGSIVVIAQAGTPMARLVPLSDAPKRQVVFGLMKGEFEISPDFDSPLPENLLDLFEGKGGA